LLLLGRYEVTKQESDKLLWVVTVIDQDEENPNPAVKVNIAADVEPAMPKTSDGSRAVEFVGLRVMPYLESRGDSKRLAYSVKADAVKAPSTSGKAASVKEAA
jgi:hypothetical protein